MNYKTVQPYFSFVITTKNEELNIRNLIESIINQSFTDYEIIIIDNFSTDRTEEICTSYNQVSFFHYGPERGQQRTFGVNKAKGKYIIWPDADHILESSLLQDCYDLTKNNKNLCLFIPERIIVNNYFNKIRNFERSFYDGTPIDCPRLIPKEIFLKIIDEQKKTHTFNAGPDDWDIYNYCEIYSNFGISSSKMMHNETKLTIKQYFEKKRKYMNEMNKFLLKWKNHRLNNFRFGITNRLILVFFRKGKILYTFKNIHLFIPLLLIRLYVGLIYFIYK